MGDWYGVANAGAIVLSIAARLHILGQQRQTRDDFMKPRGAHPQGTRRTCIVIRSDGKMVTTLQTPEIVFRTIVQPTEPIIYTVVLLVSSTIAGRCGAADLTAYAATYTGRRG